MPTKFIAGLTLAILVIFGFFILLRPATDSPATSLTVSAPKPQKETLSSEQLAQYQTAVFAGGCFWCVESAFEHTPGVVEAVSGYTGGTTSNPTYKEVSTNDTGHFEAVLVYFDESVVSYEELLTVLWKNIDPTDDGGQFSDRGSSYKTAIFYANEQQRLAAQASKTQLEQSQKFSKPIVTPLIERGEFYEAEEYHQDYYLKNPTRYKLYRRGSGRETFIIENWGSDAISD